MAERNDSIVHDADASEPRLSYKFQRLRERIRAAIDGGELAGKLPGERTLARQFNVNAKTLSKALTDLAAEGVLERNIGLGTFVRGHSSTAPVVNALLLTSESDAQGLTDAFVAAGVQATSHPAASELPPSLIGPYRVLLVASLEVSDDTVRSLLVRGKDVITVDRLSKPYSTHAVMPHTDRAAVQAAAEFAAAGVKRLVVATESASVVTTIRAALPGLTITMAGIHEIAKAVMSGDDSIVCDAAMLDGVNAAVGTILSEAGLPPKVIGFGRLASASASVTPGYYITDAMVAKAVAEILTAGLPHKPLTLWLAGQRFESTSA